MKPFFPFNIMQPLNLLFLTYSQFHLNPILGPQSTSNDDPVVPLISASHIENFTNDNALVHLPPHLSIFKYHYYFPPISTSRSYQHKLAHPSTTN